jgi:hypothetical protein
MNTLIQFATVQVLRAHRGTDRQYALPLYGFPKGNCSITGYGCSISSSPLAGAGFFIPPACGDFQKWPQLGLRFLHCSLTRSSLVIPAKGDFQKSAEAFLCFVFSRKADSLYVFPAKAGIQ